MLVWLVGSALAGECVPAPLADVVVPADGVTGLAVRGVTGELEIVGSDEAAVRASGSGCAGAKVRIAEREGILTATVRAREGEEVALKLVVPRSLAALTVDGHAGPVRIEALEGRLAVVNGRGDVSVRGGGDLRVAYTTGDVLADGLGGTLILDHVTGRVETRAVRGDVVRVP